MTGDYTSADDPYADYAFEVGIDGETVAGFSAVTGLEMEMETVPYREGGVDDHVHRLPGQFDHASLELRRGLTADRTFWEWIRDVMIGTITRKHVRVKLTDRDEDWIWQFQNAYPTAWRGPDLTSNGGGIAIESIDFTYEQFDRLSGSLL
jgi:phage tail-like protein